MRFTLRQVQTFLEVAGCGSFSAAARSLGLAQSSVSDAIANLEVALGTSLFDRSRRDPVLTDAGHALLLEAQVLYDLALSFERHGDFLAEGNPRSITIALGVPQVLLTPVLVEFSEKFPYIDLEVLAASDQEASHMVRAGEVSLAVALTRANYDEGLQFRLLGRIVMSHVVHSAHPLASETVIPFATLRSHRRLVLSDQAHGIATSEYLQSPQTWLFQTYESLLNGLMAGIGWATIARFLVADRLKSGVLKELVLEAYPHTDWEVSIDLIWSNERPLHEAERWLIQSLSQHRINDRIRALTSPV